MKKLNDSIAIVGNVRLSYLAVFKPKLNDLKGAKEYSAVLLFPKVDCIEAPSAQQEIKDVVAFIKDVVFSKWGDKPPAKLRNPMRDGDTEVGSDGEPKYPGYMFMSVSAKEEYPPMVIDPERNPVGSGWNSGDWGKAKLKFFAYDKNGNRGVSAGLLALQFLVHGEPLAGGGASADGFDDESSASSGSQTAGDEYDPFGDE